MKSSMYLSNFITVLTLPVYFISDNHFKIDIDASEKDRRENYIMYLIKLNYPGAP